MSALYLCRAFYYLLSLPSVHMRIRSGKVSLWWWLLLVRFLVGSLELLAGKRELSETGIEPVTDGWLVLFSTVHRSTN